MNCHARNSPPSCFGAGSLFMSWRLPHVLLWLVKETWRTSCLTSLALVLHDSAITPRLCFFDMGSGNRSQVFLWLVSQALLIPSPQPQTNPFLARNFEILLCLNGGIPEKRNADLNGKPLYLLHSTRKVTHSKGFRISEHSISNACHAKQTWRVWLFSAIFSKALIMSYIKT